MQRKDLFLHQRTERCDLALYIQSPSFRTGCGRGCFIGFLSAAEVGVLARGDRRGAHTPDDSASAASWPTAHRRHLEVHCRARSFCAQSWADVLGAAVSQEELWSEVWGVRPLHVAPWERGHQTKPKGKKVRLYYPDSIFISLELLMCFGSDNMKINKY